MVINKRYPAMTEQEKRIKAKLPEEDTGIEVRRTMCDICSPGMHCGINAYIKDGKVIKIEGLDGHPTNDGRLCTKGMANREFIYSEDRILSPLRRVGERGEGKFEAITWEEAYAEIAANLNRVKAEDGPESTVFYSGYSKWYRQMLRRFAYAYGTPNYGCESSACYTSAFMAWKALAGNQADADFGNSDLFLGWACNPFYSCYMYGSALLKRKEQGMKFIIVDTRRTPAVEKLADLFLQPKQGTDGALAHAISNVLIERGWIDQSYIDRYVYGFEEFAEYVKQFNESNVEELTGVPYELVVKAAEMIHESHRMSANESSAPISHHRNGFQNYRAIMSILAITGNFDVEGGQQLTPHSYMHVACGVKTNEEKYLYENKPANVRPCVGSERFPLWEHMEGEMQAMDLPRQILEGTPYPIKAVYALGMNARMFPDSTRMFEALKRLDFFVDTDLFLTDTAKYADIVLPACSSFERGEFKLYPSGTAWYTSPAITPLGESKSDVQILTELANYMKLPDPVLLKGYDYFVQHYILDDFGVTVEELKVIIRQFGEAAKRVQIAGGDGVEIHAAHAHGLLGGFLSPLYNKRTDEYGGDINARLKLTLEVIAEVRKQCGDDFIIDVRISGDEYSDGGLNINDMIYVSKQLEKAGVDFIHISGGNTVKRASSIPAPGTKQGSHCLLSWRQFV